jgi:endonuclease-3
MTGFDIDAVLAKVADAVKPYPKSAMFELAERGFSTPFQQLVACMISIRTRDEESLPISERLFKRAPTADAIAALSTDEIAALIRPSTFYERKAVQIRTLAERVRDEFGGDLPCDEETMRSFDGVGIKCSNLAMGIACGKPVISVDIHVHRVCNRWGYVRTMSPGRTHDALIQILPERHRVEINAVLVPFGKHICTGVAPRCSTCPVEDACQKVGVTSHR